MFHDIKLRTIVILQARMGSTRLPEKIFKDVLEKPLLAYELERLRRVKNADAVVIATTTNPIDQPIVDFCRLEQVPLFRGSEENVLDRYYQAAKFFSADVIVRICGDCPLIDPQVVEDVISFYKRNYPKFQYVSNTLERTFPRGMDVEVFSFEALENAANLAERAEEREHVTPYIYRHPELFSLGNFAHLANESHHRWTVDTDEDFQLISKIITALYPQKTDFTLNDILDLFKIHPDWLAINAHIQQKSF